jgi:hypothetical protein
MEKRPKKKPDPKITCGQQLKALVKEITAVDRRNAMAKFNISYVTVSRYLQGKVANLVLGINLLNYFTTTLDNRSSELDKLVNR